MTIPTLTRYLLGSLLLIIGILLWPRWMSMTKRLLSDKIYFLLASRLSYSAMRGLFSGIFYLFYGLVLASTLIVLFPDVDYFILLGVNKTVNETVSFLLETILLFFAGVSLIFVTSNLMFQFFPRMRITPRSYEQSWMEIYLQISSKKILLVSAFFPVLIEEFLFRVVILAILYQAWESSGLVNHPFDAILLSAITGTLVFCFQQAIFLKTREQLMMVLNGAFFIGLINSIALLLGTSFLSALLIHHAYLIFFILQQLVMKKTFTTRARMLA